MAVFVFLGFVSVAGAQWLNVKDPRIPRTSDGKPDVSAPAPRTAAGTPSLQGTWRPALPRHDPGEGMDVPLQPWARALYEERRRTNGANRPTIHCLPAGIPDGMMVRGLPWKVVQTPDVTIILIEEFTYFRQIFSDGRRLPSDPNPTWLGYSVGEWQGDTFASHRQGSMTRLGSMMTDCLTPKRSE